MEDPSMRAWITEVSYDDSESLEEKTRDVVPIVATGRRTRNTLKGKGEAIWPHYLVAALIEGLKTYTPDGSQSSKPLSRFIMRNHFISDYIFETTGKRRTPKQVGNCLQQLRDTRKRDKTMRDKHTGKTIWVNIVLERSSWSSPPPVINIVNNEKVMPLVIHLAPASGVSPSLSRFDSLSTGLLSNLVTFASPYTLERHCSFSVFADNTGPPIHTESAVLTEHLREKSSESLYGVSLVPSLWKSLCENTTPTRFTIAQTLYIASPTASSDSKDHARISVVYDFTYPESSPQCRPTTGVDFSL